MKATEILKRARGRPLKHTRQFACNIHRPSFYEHPDEVNTAIIGNDDPKVMDSGAWNILVDGWVFFYDVDPEIPDFEFVGLKSKRVKKTGSFEVHVETGSGDQFVDTFEILD